MPIAIGTAIISANSELRMVTCNKPAMPNRRLSESVVLNSELVMKLALFACSYGTACTISNSAMSAIAAMIVAPAARAREPKTLSPHRPLPRRPAGDFPDPSVGIAVDTIELCPAGRGAEVPRLGSGVIVNALGNSRLVTHEMALIAVANLPLKESGTGMYPLSVKPSWPLPIAAVRKARVAGATSASGYFEQTTE